MILSEKSATFRDHALAYSQADASPLIAKSQSGPCRAWQSKGHQRPRRDLYVCDGTGAPVAVRFTSAAARNPSPALRRNHQGVARPFPRPPRRSGAPLRCAFRADVGILSRLLRNRVSPPEHDGVPDPGDQAPERGAGHLRLHHGGCVRSNRGAPRRCGWPANEAGRLLSKSRADRR
jgi:hypothetical protein